MWTSSPKPKVLGVSSILGQRARPYFPVDTTLFNPDVKPSAWRSLRDAVARAWPSLPSNPFCKSPPLTSFLDFKIRRWGHDASFTMSSVRRTHIQIGMPLCGTTTGAAPTRPMNCKWLELSPAAVWFHRPQNGVGSEPALGLQDGPFLLCTCLCLSRSHRYYQTLRHCRL